MYMIDEVIAFKRRVQVFFVGGTNFPGLELLSSSFFTHASFYFSGYLYLIVNICYFLYCIYECWVLCSTSLNVVLNIIFYLSFFKFSLRSFNVHYIFEIIFSPSLFTYDQFSLL